MKSSIRNNTTGFAILINTLTALVSLFTYGMGVYLTIHADIGAGPWDVLNLGLSKTLGILYGTASISVSVAILIIDILLREPIGIAMFIDAVVVGKAVDFFNLIDIIPKPKSLAVSIAMMLLGLVIMGYSQFFYMRSALGCGPRDTLLVGIKRRTKHIPIGIVSIIILGLSTLTGYFLGGKVGIGTIICAFLSGPVMQLAFTTVRFDATSVRHQSLHESFRVIFTRRK